MLDHLGEKIDLISCPYETTYWGDRYQSFHLRDLPVCVACSKNHPLVATIPVDWDYTMPYGLIYAKDPPQEVLQFIMAVGQMGSE